MVLPNFLWGWQTISGWTGGLLHAPITVKVVLKPEHTPLTADHALFTLLASTENKTGKQVQELLAYGFYYDTQSLKINGETIDLKEVINSKIKLMAPDKDYYLKIEKNGKKMEFGYPVKIESFDPCAVESMLTFWEFGQGVYSATTTLTLPNLERASVFMVLR